VRAFARLALLVALGFGAGLVIGVVSEEPELLAGHLRGEGQSVELANQDSEEAKEDGTIAVASAEVAGDPRSEAARSANLGTQPRSSTQPMQPTHPTRSTNATPSRESRTDRTLPAVAAAPRAGVDAKSSNDPAPDDHEWAIQVGAFTDEVAAKRLSDGLIAKGYPAKLVPATSERRWRVRVQPILDRSSAGEMADRLKRIEGLPTWVIPMEARSGL
jgi:cell division protein FtsN